MKDTERDTEQQDDGAVKPSSSIARSDLSSGNKKLYTQERRREENSREETENGSREEREREREDKGHQISYSLTFNTANGSGLLLVSSIESNR